MPAPADQTQAVPKPSIFKRALSTIVDMDETTKAVAQPAVQPQQTSPVALPPLSAGSIAVPAPMQVINQDMLARIRAKAYERTTPFKTLLATAEKMKAAVPDDRARLQAALAVVGADGARTPQTILDSIKVHVADVEAERTRFKAIAESQRAAKVNGPLQEADGLQKLIEQNANRLAELQEQMRQIQEQATANQNRINDLHLASQQGEYEITKTVADFDAAANIVVNELQAQYTDLSNVLTK